MLQETILCEFGLICATGNTLTLPETVLCQLAQICVTGNARTQLWNSFILDKFVLQEMLLCCWKCFYVSLVWCNKDCFCETNCWQELHSEFPRQNLNKNVQSPSMW